MKERAVKERILRAAIELIREEAAFEKVSMRRIADKAGVAVSMVNYHFQTKQHLIDRAVQEFVGSVIESSMTGESEVPADPVEAMRAHLRGAAAFVARNPGIARVSILRDLQAGEPGDNSSQVAQTVFRQLTPIYGEKKSERELRVLAQLQVAAVQQLFLRAEVVRELTGLDFYDDQDRKILVDIVIDTITGART